MSAVASLFPVLVRQQGDDNHPLNSYEANLLRLALNAFLSAGGIIDRLGDNREKARDCAREALVSAGTIVSRSSAHSTSQSAKASQPGKGPEPPLVLFERYLRDLGFSSKVSRVREQVGAPISFSPSCSFRCLTVHPHARQPSACEPPLPAPPILTQSRGCTRG